MTYLQSLQSAFAAKGGWHGFAAFLSFMAVLVMPPWLVLEILDVPAFTTVRLLLPLLWALYLLVGSARVKLRLLDSSDAIKLAFWPAYTK